MIMPYLSFTGDCEEAFLLYQRALGGQDPLLARYGDAPPEAYPDLDESMKNKVMHGHIMLTETGGISGADALWPVEKGSNVSIHVFCTSPDHARQAFAVLAEEGQILGEIAQNPPPHDDSLSGMVKDKFGFTWVLSA